MSQHIASPGDEDLQGTSIGRKSLLDSTATKDEQQRYHIHKRIGEGGFGAVYLAADTFDNDRVVAIKVIHLGGLSAQQIIEATDSFNREVKLLTMLSHPQLPRVYDHFTDASRWYMVMDFIEGETLDTSLEQRKLTGSGLLPQDKVLDIAHQLCNVLAYLHTHEPPVIFRDLKPGNIMLSPTGQLYLIDFGIARHFKPGKVKDTIPLGSPGYAAPEQYGKAQTSAVADIYSLGALLHFLQTGDDPADDPFHFASLPSTLGTLGPLITRMLSSDPLQRPQRIDTVMRIIDGSAYTGALQALPAAALPTVSPPTKGASSRPRHRAVGRWRQRQMYARPARKSRGHALTRRQAITSLSVIGGLWLAGMSFASWQLMHEHINLSFLNAKPVDTTVVPDPPTPIATPLPDLVHTRYIYVLHQAPVNTAAWSPDGRLIASGDSGLQRQLQVWKPYSEYTITLRGHTGAISQVAWSPDGKRLVSASYDQTVRVWEPATATLVNTYRGLSAVGDVSWSPDGKRFAAAFNNNQMQVWDTVTGNLIMSYNGHRGHGGSDTAQRCAIAWSPRGQYIASSGHDATVQVWNANSGRMIYVFRGSTTPVTALVWSLDGKSLAFCSDQFYIWQPATGEYWSSIENACTCVGWSPDGRRLAYGFHSQVQVIDAATGEPLFTYRSHTDTVRSVAWSPDGKLLASSSSDKTVRLWTMDAPNPLPIATPLPQAQS